ncbi:MAG: ABC transporter permease [Candidatus Wallbacteria bacterium]
MEANMNEYLSYSIRLILSMLAMATPLFITALGGIFSERCGVTNIALEGMMLVGAFFGVVGTHYSGSPWIGLLVAVLAAGLFAVIHAVICIKYHSNQVVSGMALNMLASGLTVFLLDVLFGIKGTSENVPTIPNLNVLFNISNHECIAYKVFDFSPIVLIGIFLVFFSHFILFNTVFGLRLRATGEHAKAADTLGISVPKMRYYGVIISGLLAGLAGAYLSLSLTGAFRKDMSAGRGYIALAAMITGKWNPFGAFIASLFFGLAQAAEFLISNPKLFGIAIPPQFIQMLPYFLTLVVLAGFIGRAVAPGDLGKPYIKEEKI